MSTATERVGRYQLLDPIGAGPNGSVSRAKVFGVAGFERQFAVKRFASELTATSAMAQALSGAARQYGSLEHPRIARMAEFGVAQGQTFTAVELVTGLDAMRLMAEAKLAGTTLATGGGLALVSQAARAVGYAHGRGLSHLGLCPTNLVVTAEGDVKVTDFGILAATMPPKPTDVPRLANRIAYLAPEQLAGEATSAATDVFALGVIAYELVTNTRAFRGETPQQIARAILAGPPIDPQLPRPIVRVMQRCLARSPFERFPDARALADALDAALRVAPVPGTRKDIGAQVKSTMDRLAALNEGAMSGVVALNLGTGPARRADPIPPVATLGRETPETMPTSEFVRPDVDVPMPSPLIGPTRGLDSAGSTMPDLPKVPTTVAGLAPPPIPVPPGVVGPAAPPPIPPVSPHTTMMGVAAAKKPMGVPPAIPPIKPRAPSTPALPSLTHTNHEVRPMADPHEEPTRTGTQIPKLAHAMRERKNDDDLIITIEKENDPHSASTLTGTEGLRPSEDRGPTVGEREPTISEGDETKPRERVSTNPERVDTATERAASTDGLGEPTQVRDDTGNARSETASDDVTIERGAGYPAPREMRPTSEMPPQLIGALNEASVKPTAEVEPLVAEAWRQEATVEAPPPPPPVPPPPSVQPAHSRPAPQHQSTVSTHAVRTQPAKRALPIALGVIVLAGLGVGGWRLAVRMKDKKAATADTVAPGSDRKGSGAPPAVSPDAAVVVAAASDAPRALSVDAAVVAKVAPVDASVAVAVAATSSDSLQIASTPPGARVFIDGADQGVTPVKLAGSADRHSVALLLAGHELYVAEVDGHGTFQIALKAVTPAGGPAGIKVIKCKDKDRYYVTVDGKPTGMTCPTERIECNVGPHTVEVYDIVTETRRKFDINVADTRLSYRVRIE